MPVVVLPAWLSVQEWRTCMKTTFALFLIPMALAAQLDGQPVRIPSGDPDVFAAFLRMHHAIVSTTEATGSSANTGSAPSAGLTSAPPSSGAWQRDLGIRDADFSKIEPAYLALKARVDEIKAAAAAY